MHKLLGAMSLHGLGVLFTIAAIDIGRGAPLAFACTIFMAALTHATASAIIAAIVCNER